MVVVVLAAVVLFTPVAMAFDNCAMMGATCEAPCGASSYAVFALPAPIALSPVVVGDPGPRPDDQLPAGSVTLLDPPPKSLLLSL